MSALAELAVIKQHLIDPEICIRCNTCESICPQAAITHDARNYVVDANKCNWCNDCIAPCPTGAIDNYRSMPRAKAYAPDEQLGWDELPRELSKAELAAIAGFAAPALAPAPASASASALVDAEVVASAASAVALMAGAAVPDRSGDLGGLDGFAQMATAAPRYGASIPPWSAAHAYTNLYGPKAAQKSVTASVVGNRRVTAVGKDYDTHHIVLDFGSVPFLVLEGQSIGINPPGVDASGKPLHTRQYSIASPRNGERAGHNNISLTVKRVLEDHAGNSVRGVASNYLCDLQVGDRVQVVGPFGASFLMPNHPRSSIVMICTGTGSAPMRAMTEWRRRLHASGKFEGGKLMLFFGARTAEELPYFGPLQKLPHDFIDINFAFSRASNQAKRYVQDVMRERAVDLAPLLADPNAYFYVCGLKSMEEGVMLALREIALQAKMDWEALGQTLKREGRLHLETY